MSINSDNKTKILIIDDNQGILFVMKQALELKDHHVRTVSSFEGVDAIVEFSPDIIFLYVSLADQDGRAVCRELKSNNATKDIPIIMLTAYSDAHKLAKEATADDFLSKPFELEDLWEKTEKYTKQKTT